MQRMQACLALMATLANATIVDDGLWTGNDFYDSVNKIGVVNGIPYSEDAKVDRRIKAPLTIDGSVDDIYLTRPNVLTVQSLFSSADWDAGFPQANALYTYDNFLKAVAKFPSFCNEAGPHHDQTLEVTCKRELATLFAHWGQETGKRDPADGEFWTQGLYYIEEMRCSGTTDASCDYKSGGWADEAWPPSDDEQYYGRGPFQLTWNYNYGRFSNVFAPSAYDSKLYLLENPDLLHTDGFLAMAAGLWFYMTPQDPKPSMHDVITGFFEPTSADVTAGITTSFGTTINIINGGNECGQATETSMAVSRGEYFLEWLDFFGLEAEGHLGCSTMTSYFPYGGAGDAAGYWAQDWSGATACKAVTYQTEYSISARDDYKRCVCDLFGDGETDCPQSGETAPIPDIDPYEPDHHHHDDDDHTHHDDDDHTHDDHHDDDHYHHDPHWTTFETLEEIRANPHYSEDSNSRTMYQVDREIDFIEDKLAQVVQTLIDAGLLQ